jgi:hypothetical protein
MLEMRADFLQQFKFSLHICTCAAPISSSRE